MFLDRIKKKFANISDFKADVLIPFLVFFVVLNAFVFAFDSTKIVQNTNRKNFEYNMQIIEYMEQLDEVFQRAAANVDIFADSAYDLYDVSKFNNKAYNQNFIKTLNPVSKAILTNYDGGQGSWFQLNTDFPNGQNYYTWHIMKGSKVIDFAKSIKGTEIELREMNEDLDPYYFNAIKGKKPYWSSVYEDADLQIKMITFARPIYKHNVLIGVAGLDISVESIMELLQDIQDKFVGSELFVLNEKMNIVLTKLNKDRNFDAYDAEFINKIRNNPPDHSVPLEYKDASGQHKIGMVIKLDNNYLTIITFPNDIAFRGFNRLFASVYLFFVVLIALLIRVESSRNKIISVNKKLELETAKLYAVFNSVPSMIAIKNAAGVYTECNTKFLELYEFERNEVIGKTEYEIFDKDVADNINKQENYARAIRQPVEENVWHTRKNEDKILLHKFRIPLYDSTGSYVATLISATDITNQAKELELLQNAKDQAEKATMMKSNFLANMSHEIRTPMNGVMGFLQLLEDTQTTDEQREFISDAKKSSELLLSIINEILDFSKIEAGKLKLDYTSFDIRSLIEDVTVMATSNAAVKNLELNSLICSDVPMRLYGDPSRLKQILNNLVNNSIKFTHEGEITIHVSAVEQSEDSVNLEFKVKDTGIGISEDKLQLVFESFTQADASTTRKYGGTGLGLTISQKLAKLMGGEIVVESFIDEGSTFTLKLPFRKDNSAPAAADYSTLKGNKILVFSNNQTDLKIIKYYLNEAECEIFDTESSAEFCQILKSNPDIRLGVVSQKLDIENEDIILDCHNDIPLILLSSIGIRGESAEAKDKGYSAYLTKPIRKAELLECINQLLSGNPVDKKKFLTRHHLREQKFNSKARILVVEDSELNSKLIVKILKNSGLTCDLAANGREAVNAFVRNTYDLIIMDCQMPVLDGYEATKEIRMMEGLTSRVPIIALTANAYKVDKDRCFEAGMDDYISKPVDVDTFLTVLSKYIKIDSEMDSSITLSSSTDSTVFSNGVVERLTNEFGFAKDEAIQFFNQYVEFLSTSIEQMKDYIESENCIELKAITHKLKGASANLGLTEARKICLEMETSLKNPNKEDCFLILSKLTKLLEILKTV